eukprot:COSAG05_NODE_1474_length_4783_cov_4.459863_3_plen_101_part_00
MAALQWVRANGCDWDRQTCINAAAAGHLETLKWAVANGAEWEPLEALPLAAKAGQRAVLQWARARGSWSANVHKLCLFQARRSSSVRAVQLCKWLLDNDV